MRHVITLLIATFAVGCIHAQRGNGVSGREARTITGFDSIAVASAIHATVGNGPWSSLVLTGDENLLPLIETTVSGNSLTVKVRGCVELEPTLPMKMTLTLPALVGVEASGASTLAAETAPSDSFRAESSGGATIDVHGLAAASTTVDASGGSVVNLSGRSGTLGVDASGGAQVLTGTVSASAATVTASGDAEVEVDVSQSLTADLSGGSQLRVLGQPGTRHVVTSGGATIQYQ
jgi:hypothetical protein